MHTNIPVSTPNAPPGFENLTVKSPSNHTALQCADPQMSWRPPSAVHSDAMRRDVQADDSASLETGLQMKREVRILEASHPRPSSLPDSPIEPVEPYDDRDTPQIPLEPLEEEELVDESLVHVHRNWSWSWNNKADVQAAATAACAALSEYYQIDNEHFKQIVSNPTLIQSLTTSKSPDISSTSMNFNVSRWPDQIDQAKVEWINPPSKSDMSLAAGGNEEHESTRSQFHVSAVQSEGPPGFGSSKPNGNDIMPPSFSGKSPSQAGGQAAAVECAEGDGFHKTQGSEDIHFLPGALDDRHLFTSPTIGGKVGRRQVPRPSLCSESPPGFGRSKPNDNDIMPPSFSGKSLSQAGGQTAAVESAEGDGFHKTQGSEDMHLLPGALDDRHLFTSPTIGGKVGRRQVLRPSLCESPPGFGRSKPNGNDIMPPSFSGKSPSQVVGQAAEVETAAPHFKPWKPCHYFGTARGCRNGDNCRFLHDVQDAEKNAQKSSRGNTQNLGRAPIQQLRKAKRRKVDG